CLIGYSLGTIPSGTGRMPPPPFSSTSYRGRLAPPGRPKMVSTPSLRSDSITICEPVYSLSSVVISVPRNRFLSIRVIDAPNGGFVSAGRPIQPACNGSSARQMAPRAADDTRRAYLASAPLVYLGAGACH